MDPDFGVKTSLRLASRKRGNCQLGAEADSEIPELGLDGGRLSVDCEVNPFQVAGAAYQAAREYGKYRRARKHHQPEPSGIVKSRRTQITVDRDYVKSKGRPGDQEPEEDDEDEDGNRQTQSGDSALPPDDGEGDDD